MYILTTTTTTTTVVVVVDIVCQKSSGGSEVEREVMAFNTKKKFFEQEIENAQQSRPSSSFHSTS